VKDSKGSKTTTATYEKYNRSDTISVGTDLYFSVGKLKEEWCHSALDILTVKNLLQVSEISSRKPLTTSACKYYGYALCWARLVLLYFCLPH